MITFGRQDIDQADTYAIRLNVACYPNAESYCREVLSHPIYLMTPVSERYKAMHSRQEVHA